MEHRVKRIWEARKQGAGGIEIEKIKKEDKKIGRRDEGRGTKDEKGKVEGGRIEIEKVRS